MNLQTAQSLAGLQRPVSVPNVGKKVPALVVAKKVFQLAAQGGFPYQKQSPEQWARKWLKSKEFTLMEIDINAAASPHLPRNPDRVAYRLLGSQDSIPPIVVDLNKQGVGRSHLGFIPEVIVLDGKHRKMAMQMQGHGRILAWVGCKALPKIRNAKVITDLKAAAELMKLDNRRPDVHSESNRLATSFNLYAATAPSVGLPTIRQDAGEGGSRPSGPVTVRGGKKKVKSAGGTGAGGMGGPGASNTGGSGFNPQRVGLEAERDCNACGARSSGSLEEKDSSDEKVPPDASDAGPRVEPSDQLKWNPNKPNLKAPGTTGNESKIFSVDPAKASPGSGSGPRVPSPGATRSDFARGKLKAKGIKLDKIYQEYMAAKKGGYQDADIDAVAPPGFGEAKMHSMKKKFGKTSAFRLAWYLHNKKKGQD